MAGEVESFADAVLAQLEATAAGQVDAREAFARLCQEHGGHRVYLPARAADIAERYEEMRALYREGVPMDELSVKFDVTVRRVRQIVAGQKK